MNERVRLGVTEFLEDVQYLKLVNGKADVTLVDLESAIQKLREKNPNPGQPDAETQEAVRGRLPPTQVSLPQGAVLLRDARGWHRGQPAPTN